MSECKEERDPPLCPICYEPYEEQKTATVSFAEDALSRKRVRIEILSCRHSFCAECLGEYVLHSISTQRIPISCPQQGNSKGSECKEELTDNLVQNLIGSQGEEDAHLGKSSLWKKYLRCAQLARDPTLLFCLRCDTILSQNIAAKVDPQGFVECEDCRHLFCPIHGDAHPGIACDAYKTSDRAIDVEKTERSIQAWTKPCSHCAAPIQKDGGCDHVVCPVCDQDMCYKCGTHEFLRGQAVRVCDQCKQGYVDHRYECQYRLRLCLVVPLLLPALGLYVVAAATLAVLSGCFVCFCGLGTFVKGRDLKEEGSRISLCRGVAHTFIFIFLPVLTLMQDFGFHNEYVDRVLSPGRDLNEAPTMLEDGDEV